MLSDVLLFEDDFQEEGREHIQQHSHEGVTGTLLLFVRLSPAYYPR